MLRFITYDSFFYLCDSLFNEGITDYTNVQMKFSAYSMAGVFKLVLVQIALQLHSMLAPLRSQLENIQ